MKVMEAIITADRLEGCDEAFITNSISGIVPLIAVDCKAIGSRRPGPVTTAIQEMYSGLVLEVCKTSCKRV